MSGRARVLAVACLTLLCVCFAADPGAAAVPSILPLSEVKPGMVGVGLTVFRGTEIETFGVEILGIIANNRIDEQVMISGDSILIRVFGENVDRVGGIMAGMSGSPVFVDGKMVGGIASAWTNTDHHVGFLTPIEEMLKLLDLPARNALARDDELPAPNLRDDVRERGGPLAASGLSETSRSRLSARLRRRVVPVAADRPVRPVATSEVLTEKTIEPGHAIALGLARGDINVAALGTLTWRDEKRFVGLAHSFMKRGRTEMFLAPATVFHSFSATDMPFKGGTPGEPIGVINEDRTRGVAGRFGSFPRTTTLRVSVSDPETGIGRTTECEVVLDPAILRAILEAAVLQTIDEVVDRVGRGSARVRYRFAVRGRGAEPVAGVPGWLNAFYMIANAGARLYERSDVVRSSFDLGAALALPVLTDFDAVAGNPFQEVEFDRIDVAATVVSDAREAELDRFEVEKDVWTPGETLEATLYLRGFRCLDRQHVAELALPADLSPGTYTLRVSTGGEVENGAPPDLDSLVEQGTPPPAPSTAPPLPSVTVPPSETLEEYLGKLGARAQANEIRVELVPDRAADEPVGPKTGSGSKKTGRVTPPAHGTSARVVRVAKTPGPKSAREDRVEVLEGGSPLGADPAASAEASPVAEMRLFHPSVVTGQAETALEIRSPGKRRPR